jgi:hypothetical protein
MAGEGLPGIIGYVAAGLSSRAETRDLHYYAKKEDWTKKWLFGKTEQLV